MIAKVLVDVKAKNVNKTYDYLVPEQLRNFIEVGARVIVSFGNRTVMGFILELTQSSEYNKDLKLLNRLLDIESYLTQELIDLAKELAFKDNNLLINVLETMLPSVLKVIYKPKIKLNNFEELTEELKDTFRYHSQVLLENIDESLYPMVAKAINLGSLSQVYEIQDKRRNLSKRFVKLTSKKEGLVTLKQQSVLDYLERKRNNEELLMILLKKVSITQSVVNTLEKKGFLEVFEKEVYRKITSAHETLDKKIDLSAAQKEVYDTLCMNMHHHKTFLLHGVTGSGKTEVYIKAIEKVVQEGKSVILLVPEIALTPVMISRFKSKFKEKVAALHSGLSALEKYDEWRRIIVKEARIVIGARSACFAPLNDLGLVIIDECHESTYKQTTGVIYYAIDVLLSRAKKYNCPVLMGSATPNIDSYARAKKGYYDLLELPHRAMNSSMPKVEVIDMLDEFKSGNNSPFSKKMIDEINQRLISKEQTILMMNRRGYANFVICRECGYVYKCPNCDISLTYHEYSHSLKCHYCNHEETVPQKCSKCGSTELNYLGSGTQKIEKQLREIFKEAKILRMDNDTTRRKNSHEKILKQFEREGDILIGTQMIAKGLDFPKVTLVGIIQADSNLFLPDFRAAEKTFQLIMQVSGRAGRREIEGKVIIQALNKEHYAIKYACENDYLGFYQYEMKIRRLAKYSPFYYLINVQFKGDKIRDVYFLANEFSKLIKRKHAQEVIVLGPAIDQTRKINQKYEAQVLIKYREQGRIDSEVVQIIDSLEKKHVSIVLDRYLNVG